MEGVLPTSHPLPKQRLSPKKTLGNGSHLPNKQNQVGTVMLYGIPIVSLVIESQERLCLAQISNTLLKQYSYNEIHNRRVALGITCVQCTPVQLEILRRAGAMPVSSRRCGMITRREAERLCKSFLGDNAPPRLPDDFAFSVHHECAWGCRGAFLPSRYNSSRAKCIKCTFCGLFFSPNKFIFHSHRTSPNATYVQPDAANFNSWRRHMKLSGSPPDDVVHAWEDVKAMFNGGTRKRLLASSSSSSSSSGSGALPIRSSLTTSVPITMVSTPTKQIKLDTSTSTNSPYPTPTNTPIPVPTPPRVSPFPDLALPISVMDYVWHNGVNAEGIKHQFPFASYAVPWFGNAKRSVLGLTTLSTVSPQQESFFQHLCPPNNSDKFYHHSAFRPVFPTFTRPDVLMSPGIHNAAVKRQMNSEELLLPKKKYSRESEKGENPSTEKDYNDSEELVGGLVNENHRTEPIDKENEKKKTTANGDTRNSDCSEPLPSGSPHNGGLNMTFKKELTSEIVTDPEEVPKSVPKARIQPENKDIIDMSRLLSIKSNLLEESVLKFREFSPNLLEAISTLKTDDRGVYSGLAVKMYQDVSVSDAEKESRGNMEMTTDYGRLKGPQTSEEQCKNGRRTDEDEYEYEDNDDDDDEPVDVETTDDIPVGETSACQIQDSFEKPENPGAKITEEIGSPGMEKTNKIWAIARFSVEQSDREPVSPHSAGFYRASERGVIYKSRRETDYIKNTTEHKK